MENGRTPLTDYMLLKISSKSFHLKQPNNQTTPPHQNISFLRGFKVNIFVFQIVNKKTDFIPTHIKWNTLEFFTLVFQILIPFCYLAFQIVSIGIYFTFKIQRKYKPDLEKNWIQQKIPNLRRGWTLYWSWTLSS